MSVAVGAGWWIGWAVGVVVVLVAAALLLAIIGLARRIARQADEITAVLDGARENTTPLFDVKRTNFAIDRITRGLRAVRTGEAQPRPPTEHAEAAEHGRSPMSALRRAWEERKGG